MLLTGEHQGAKLNAQNTKRMQNQKQYEKNVAIIYYIHVKKAYDKFMGHNVYTSCKPNQDERSTDNQIWD